MATTDPNCIFCRIVRGEIPGRKVYEDADVLAFHDIQPIAPVHFMLVPKKHIASLYDATMDDAPVLGRMLALAGSSPHTPRGVLLLCAIGVLATAAQMMMTRASRIGHTLANARLQYVGIAFSFAFGVILFDDRVTAAALAGMALIVVAGLAATSLRTRQQPDNPDARPPPYET